MRLWDDKLLKSLDRQRLLGQHRECCALRGFGWGKKHSTVDYIKKYDYYSLYLYHRKVMMEIRLRGYKVESKWDYSFYRGQKIGFDFSSFTAPSTKTVVSYIEHNEKNYKDNIKLLLDKTAEKEQVDLYKHYHKILIKVQKLYA